MSFLCSDDMSTEDFIRLAKAYSEPKRKLVLMAFSPTEAVFEPLNDFETRKSFLAETDQGRIFSSEGELKWRRVEGRLRVVYLGDAPPQGLIDYSPEIAGLDTGRNELILWGVRTDIKNEWIEQQIPHRFEYPISGKPIFRGRVALVIEDWLDSSGFVRFSRYHSLKEIPGEA